MAAILFRKPEVRLSFGISSATVYQWAKLGLLTPPVRIGPRASAWPACEITAIAQARIGGKTETEVQELVKRLIAARQKAA